MENIIVGSAGFTAGAAVTALILAMSRVAYMLDGANRTGMDTPPGFMTLVWPLIKLIDFFVAANLPICQVSACSNFNKRYCPNHGKSLFLIRVEWVHTILST